MMLKPESSPTNSASSVTDAVSAAAVAVINGKPEPPESEEDEDYSGADASATSGVGLQHVNLAQSAGVGGGRRKDTKVCRVCGDKALGFNFDAISCESCKAFFRRNALKADVPACMFTKECSVTVATRRFCTYCRLQKCLQVGMRPELVNADEVRGKKVRREVPTPQQPQQQSQPKLLPMQMQSQPVQLPAHQQQQQQQQQQIRLPTVVDEATGLSTASSAPSSSQTSQTSAASSTPQQQQQQQQQQMVLNPTLHATGGSRSLTHEQWLAVSDLYQAYELSFSDTSEDASPAGCRNLNTLVNSSCFIVKKLILFAKKLPDFIGLSQSCQIALLKGAVIGTLFLRSAVHYDRERDVWVTPKGDVPTAILKDIPGFAELHDDHLKFCRLFKDLLRDPFLVPLVQVLALFTPDRPNVADRSAVADVQDRYICLLKHYLEGRCGFTEARRLLPRILSAMEELHDLAGGHGRLLLHVNPNEVDPLLLEVFDIAAAAAAAPSAATTAAAPPVVGGVPMCVYQRRPAV